MFPFELVSIIFEFLYDSLSRHTTNDEYDAPIGAKVVFTRTSLVSRGWHALSLPFLVRHFDGENVEAFTAFCDKYRLFQDVRSIYLNPAFTGWPDPGEFTREEWYYEAGSEPERNLDCGEASLLANEKQVREEFARWSTLLERSVPTLSILEIGSRRRAKLERGPWYGAYHQSLGRFSDSPCPWGELETAPSLDLAHFLSKLRIGVEVHTLRLNLPDEGTTTSQTDVEQDEQFARLVGHLFPRLKNYCLHAHNVGKIKQRTQLVPFPPLERLQLLNVLAGSGGWRFNLRPTYLRPSAATLRYLEISMPPFPGQSSLPLRDLFGTLQFPLLEELYLDGPAVSCTVSSFFDRFPLIRTASIPLDPNDCHRANALPILPLLLTHLTLSRLDDLSLVPLANHLRRQDLTHLERLALRSEPICNGTLQNFDTPEFETCDTPTPELATIIRICSRSNVEVLYGSALPVDDSSEAGEQSEDDEFDWDGEDDPEFRRLWTNAKKREHDLG